MTEIARRAARKIWMVLPSLAGGGAERMALTLASGLRRLDRNPTLYVFAREGSFIDEAATVVPVVASRARSRLGHIVDLRGRILDAQPDVVMSFLSYAGPLAAARLSGSRAKVVFSIQTPIGPFLDDPDFPWGRQLTRPLFTKALGAALRRADAVAVASRGVGDEVVGRFGAPGDRVQVIQNPVDLDRVRSRACEAISPDMLPPANVATIVAAGRLAGVKNYPLLFDAFERVRASLPCRLIVLGGGELDASLRARVRERGLEDAVSLLGFQENPWKLMARADVFALTSRYEGFGNVLVEAMALGLPVVATASAGTRDIVRDGANGILVDSHDAASFAAALSRVLSDAQFRSQLSECARRSAAEYDLPLIARRYTALFDQLVNSTL